MFYLMYFQFIMKNYNIVTNILNRELVGGRFQSQRPFHKLPGRLGFKLEQLVGSLILHDGHVFAGFSRNGQFVFSYVLSGLDSLIPRYQYELFWWLFVPYRCLTQVGRLNLFDGIEVQSELLLFICEWPNNEDQLLVYGYSASSSVEPKQCYLTVASNPLLKSCPNCQSNYRKCLTHSFALHTHFDLTPPYPLLSPLTCMKINDSLILNSGDSVMVLCFEMVPSNEAVIQQVVSSSPVKPFECRRERTFSGSDSSRSRQVSGISTRSPTKPAFIQSNKENLSSDDKASVMSFWSNPRWSGNITVTYGCSEGPSSRSPIGREVHLCPSISDTTSTYSYSPVLIHSDAQCFTYSIRRFAFRSLHHEQDDISTVEDDISLAYHSMLPIRVLGCGSKLTLIPSDSRPGQPSVAVKQMTLDIEQYIGETIRDNAPWGRRFIAFTDYDLQIVDVCPDTNTVILLVQVLLTASPPSRTVKSTSFHGKPSMYQTAFMCSWNLSSGVYLTLTMDELTLVEAAADNKVKWQRNEKQFRELTKFWNVRQSIARSVNVMSNEAALRRESLKVLFDARNFVAILV